ncbi:Tetratricopeptide repeat protein [Roseimaritima multifibrata]|uniref:Tetratricopeptide repeat protein n=1 Tax=Roseimaritima multifibrata TaxID=1930274 RepID=A0A517MAZ6_9BACT|nr:tetratricopeptide repeat protein [Roseimaritima multifibrata]QDS92058.1 Tetratricopeptide repeat protein [Roseimaritima multifibrata]
MRKEASIHCKLLFLWGWCAILIAPVAFAQSTDLNGRLQQGLQQLAAKDYAQAHQTLQHYIDSIPSDESAAQAYQPYLLQATMANGKALTRLGQHEDALKQYLAAIEWAPKNFDRTPLQLTAADAAYRCQQWDQGASLSQQVLDTAEDARRLALARRILVACELANKHRQQAWEVLSQATESEAAGLSEFANRLGAAALGQNEVELASKAYGWILQYPTDEELQRKANLGFAWAAALGAAPPDEAAALLMGFADQYPEGEDASRALRAAATCWNQAGEPEQGNACLQQIIDSVNATDSAPLSPVVVAAAETLSANPQTADQEGLRSIRKRLFVTRDSSDNPIPASLIAASIVDAALENDESAWQRSTLAAERHPDAGEIMAATLKRLSQQGADADAERLAAYLLQKLSSTDPDASIQGKTIEAACRWAAESGKWSLLALAAEDVDTVDVAARLPSAGIRLLAEALIQTRRAAAAKRWFDAAVTAGADDFPTLVRRAELSVAMDDLTDADKNLRAAVEAAGPEDDTTLVEVLQAELLIRRARLEEARVGLERIVRMDTAAGPVRCRAQWLIGETFLLQQRYSEAIDAYRIVETLDSPPGNWTAVALVQAGKSFEKLGRHRDAATCYSGLLQRFADSEHALVARDRLAVIGADTQRR